MALLYYCIYMKHIYIYIYIYIFFFFFFFFIFILNQIQNRKELWPNNDANIQYIKNTEEKIIKRDNYTTVATEQPKIDIALKF